MKLSNISKTYISKTKDTTKAITNVSLSFSIGLTVIAGPSGSGKTTLLNIISGFLAPDSGEIIFNDKDLSKLSTKEQRELRLHDVGYYLSDKNLIEHLTVYENIILSRKLINKSINQEELMAILIKLGIDNLLNRYPSELSTGQKSRVGLARLMVKKPKLLLADEPTGALDELTSILVMDCLKELSKTSMVIIVTHDETLAKHYADRIIRLRKGIIESDSSD
ncbi:ABC-type lipoprotein export system ATPase subunit [Acholeplasma morum]|uniref:ABC transporter ATP-binding protein n=1 Tax=Paracholeplasma morum TaxID=264637 RepID=UPI00195B13D0|nr:ATP-binding cassette domain-containing protein [Paracholeplasma morum]MBM7453058.1 ABC-type lipoprotein export system ATPase subunit [Paracholeplasma morum]